MRRIVHRGPESRGRAGRPVVLHGGLRCPPIGFMGFVRRRLADPETQYRRGRPGCPPPDTDLGQPARTVQRRQGRVCQPPGLVSADRFPGGGEQHLSVRGRRRAPVVGCRLLVYQQPGHGSAPVENRARKGAPADHRFLHTRNPRPGISGGGQRVPQYQPHGLDEQRI